MATLTPVDFDPFAAAAPAPARKLTPVDYDPFAPTGSPDAQGSATPPPTEAPSLLQRLGAGAMGLANLARDPVAPVVEGLGGANLWDAIKRGSASALASTLHTGADVVDQAMLPTRMLYGDNPLGADKVAAQSLAVEKQINADRQAAQAETLRPGLGDLVTNPVEGVRKAAAYYGNTGAESLPMLALALATRNPELGSAMMGATTGAQEYTDLRSQGVPRREAAAAGALTGATEKIGESIGLPAVMGKVGSGTLRRAVATEGGQEGLTQLMQQYIDDQATGNQTSIKDQLLGALDAAVVGGALGGGGHVAINVPEMVSALTGRTAGTPPPLPGQVVEPLASTSTPAVAAPVEAAPAPDDLDTMLAALLAGRADTAPEPAPVPQQVEAPAAAAPASLGEAVAPQMPQPGAMTPADVRAVMDRARVAAEAAQGAPPTPAAPMQAPEAAAPVAPKPTPLVDDRASVEALRNEIGWETRGGQMIRGGEVDGDISSGASFGRTSGEVIGRTPWVGKPGPDGESNFWRMRPEQGGKISEKQAHVALDKYAAGQSLNAKERRFIDYARGVAKQYDDAYEADRAQFEQDQADMAEADRVRAVQELRDHQADLSRNDDGEALTLAQWVRRAHDAGVSSEKIIDATWDGSVAEQARRLSRHIADQETNRGTDTRATPIGGEGGAGQDQARPAAAGSGVAESTQGFQLEADRPAASIEGARPVASQRGLFAEPTPSDHNRAAIEAKDAQRNGLNGGRADTGDGGLFDGPRPQQADIEGEAGRASANEPKLTDFADEPRQRSIARGNEDADHLGLRAAVREALGPVADRVEYLHGYEGLPDKMRRGVESRNALGRKGVTAAMYSPDTGRVFIFTQVTKTPARAVWHAAHEIAGHEGLRALLGDRINPALNIARQNPTVKALADEIYAQRKIAEQMKKSGKTHADGVLLSTEEALAELAAAVRTGNYEHINERYGVNVPPGIRESVKAAIANFLKRLKAMIDDLFGKHVFTDQDVRSLLEAAWQAAKGKGKGATASVEHPDGSSSLEQVVFHGTPHNVDKFSLQKIGTGEGAQAYGWGMYFASEKAIAEHYRRGLAERDFINKARDVYDEYDSPEGAVQALRSIGGLSEPQKELIDALQKDDWLGFDYPHQAISAALREPQNFELSPETEAALAKQGSLYHVEVPEDSDLLDWDKPLSEQPEKVREALAGIFPSVGFSNPSGQTIYRSLVNRASSGKEQGFGAVFDAVPNASNKTSKQVASEYLNSLGIPGIRYLDGTSRAKGEGSSNYVIWDEGAIGEPQSALDSVEDQTGNRGNFDPSSPSILESTTHRTPEDARRDAAVRRAEAQRTLGGPTAGGAIGWNFDTHKWEGNEGTLRRARTQLDDKMLAWRDVQGNIAEALGRTIPDAQNVYRLENLMHGRVKEGIDALEVDRIVPLVQAMDRAKVTPAQLDEYLYARHAKERNAQIASINPAMPDGGSGMTNAEADAILARADTARLAPLARRVDALKHQTRRRLLDSGLITQEQFDAMEAQYQHYVPLRGKQVRENEFDGASQGAGRGLDTRPSPVKNALGRGAGNRAENILGEIIGDAQRSIIASEKARVGRAVMRLVLANPNPALWSVEPVQTERKLDATGEVYEAVVHDWSDPSIIAVRHRGNVYKVQINFAPLAQALNMVGVDQLSGLTRAAGALNRYFSSVLTRYNPAFIPVNAARDALFGLTGMSVEHGELAAMQAALYYPKAIRAAWKEARRAPPTTEADRFAREFAEDGGKTGYVHMPSVEDLARKIGDGRLGSYNPHGIARAGRALADMVGAMNDSVENALRLSAYATLRKRGMSREAAAAYAKEMTVNFNRKGYAGSKLNAWLLFYNASMQGAKRTVTLAKHPKTWAYLGALAAAQVAAVMYGMGQDDDDGTPIWDKVPDYVKQRNLVFTWLDDGGQQHLLTIPMPYGFNIMPYLAGRVTDAMMHREDRPQDSGMAIAADVMSASVQSFSPVPLDDGALGLVPTALRIPLSIQVNRNDWGRQIRKENPFGKFDVPRSTVGRPDTLEIFKVASKGLNRIGGGDDYTPPPMSAFDLAPEDIQYIVDKLGGGAGKFVVDVATLGQMAAGDAPVTSRDVPIVNRFTKTVDDKAAQQAMFYDRRETIERSLDKLRDTFERDGEQAALAMIKDSPELKGADFKRYKTTRDGHVAGQVIVSDGRPQIVVADETAVFGRYKAASKVVSDQNEAIRSAYTAAPMTLIPNAQRDASIRSHAQTRAEAQKAFNAAWNRDVVAGGE